MATSSPEAAAGCRRGGRPVEVDKQAAPREGSSWWSDKASMGRVRGWRGHCYGHVSSLTDFTLHGPPTNCLLQVVLQWQWLPLSEHNWVGVYLFTTQGECRPMQHTDIGVRPLSSLPE